MFCQNEIEKSCCQIKPHPIGENKHDKFSNCSVVSGHIHVDVHSNMKWFDSISCLETIYSYNSLGVFNGVSP